MKTKQELEIRIFTVLVDKVAYIQISPFQRLKKWLGFNAKFMLNFNAGALANASKEIAKLFEEEQPKKD